MKTKFTLFCLLATATMNAQLLTLQHTFTGDVTFKYYDEATQTSYYYEDDLSDLYGNAYYSTYADQEAGTYTIKRYGADFSLVSAKVFNIPKLSDYELNGFYLSRTIFDDDPNTYEFIVNYYRYDQINYTSEYKLMIYSENGNVLYDFGSSTGSFSAFPELHICNNEYRFKVRKSEYDPSSGQYTSSTYIYKVNNKKSTEGMNQIPVGKLSKKVLIDNKVYILKDNKVFDMQGREVPQM